MTLAWLSGLIIGNLRFTRRRTSYCSLRLLGVDDGRAHHDGKRKSHDGHPEQIDDGRNQKSGKMVECFAAAITSVKTSTKTRHIIRKVLTHFDKVACSVRRHKQRLAQVLSVWGQQLRAKIMGSVVILVCSV